MVRFGHETLAAYQQAVPVARWVRQVSWPRGDADLGDQARRAAASVVLNIAEGHAHTGKARLHHYRIARGSAAELCAVLDLVAPAGAAEQQEALRRVGVMLERLERVRR